MSANIREHILTTTAECIGALTVMRLYSQDLYCGIT